MSSDEYVTQEEWDQWARERLERAKRSREHRVAKPATRADLMAQLTYTHWLCEELARERDAWRFWALDLAGRLSC